MHLSLNEYDARNDLYNCHVCGKTTFKGDYNHIEHNEEKTMDQTTRLNDLNFILRQLNNLKTVVETMKKNEEDKLKGVNNA